MKHERKTVDTGLDTITYTKFTAPDGTARFYHKPGANKTVADRMKEIEAMADDSKAPDELRVLAGSACRNFFELKCELESKKPNPKAVAYWAIRLGMGFERIEIRHSERYAKAGRAITRASRRKRKPPQGSVRHDLEKFIGKDWRKIKSTSELWKKVMKSGQPDAGFKRQVARLRKNGH